MLNIAGAVHHGPDILRDMRRKSWANFFRYASDELKLKVRWIMVLVEVLGIGFAVGFFWGVAIS